MKFIMRKQFKFNHQSNRRNWNLKSAVDIFVNSGKIKLIALNGPEYGVRGDYSAGESVLNFKKCF